MEEVVQPAVRPPGTPYIFDLNMDDVDCTIPVERENAIVCTQSFMDNVDRINKDLDDFEKEYEVYQDYPGFRIEGVSTRSKFCCDTTYYFFLLRHAMAHVSRKCITDTDTNTDTDARVDRLFIQTLYLLLNRCCYCFEFFNDARLPTKKLTIKDFVEGVIDIMVMSNNCNGDYNDDVCFMLEKIYKKYDGGLVALDVACYRYR